MSLPKISWFNLNKNLAQFYKYSTKKNITYELIPEFFFIDTMNDLHILFAPLLYRVYYMPRIYISNTDPLTFNKGYEIEFIKANILIPKNIKKHLFPEKPKFSKFIPNIRILLTTACNLNCVYCYVNANKKVRFLKNDTLLKFLNAIPKKTDKLNIEFHGGEPTFSFKHLQNTFAIIKSKYPESTFMIQTNGMFNEKIMNWLLKNNITINFSIDGSEEIHNKQRPALNKKLNSFKVLMKNIKQAQNNGTGKACIVTITAYTLNKMEGIYGFLKLNNFKYIKFNPLFEEGRALLDKKETTTSPNLKIFGINLAKISLHAFQEKIMIDSDFLPNIHTQKPSYARCGAVYGQMTLCPNGDIIACADSLYLTEEEKNNPFFIGKTIKSDIKYHNNNITTLNNSTCDKYSLCQKCFLKWHCAGGCKVENYLTNKNIMSPDIKSCEAKKIFITEYFKNIGEKIGL